MFGSLQIHYFDNLILIEENKSNIDLTYYIDKIINGLNTTSDLKDKRIIYKDSQGIWIDVELDYDGNYKGFRI